MSNRLTTEGRLTRPGPLIAVTCQYQSPIVRGSGITSDVVFVVNGTASIRTTLRSSLAERLAALPPSPGVVQMADGAHRFLALAGRLEGPTAGGRVGFALLRSLDQETAVLGRVGRELTIAGVALIVVALLVGILVSTGVTRPVRRIV